MKMPGSSLFPDEPAPQTAAKKVPEGRSPPGPEKKKHTSAAAPAKKIGERRARLSYVFPNIGQTLALLPPMVLGLIAEGNAPLPGAERKAVGTRPPHPAEEGDSSPPSPVSPPPTERGLLCHISRWLTCDRQGDVLAKPKLVRGSQRLPADTTYLDREFAAQTRREVSAAYRPVSGFTLPPSVVVSSLSSVTVFSSSSTSETA